MARTQVVSDNFDSYADAYKLGDAANWKETNDSTAEVRVYNPTTTAGSLYSYGTATATCIWDGAESFNANQYATAKITGGIGTGSSFEVGVILRSSQDMLAGRDYYLAIMVDAVSQGSRATQMWKVRDGTFYGPLVTATNDNWVDGDTITLEAIDNGANVDLKVYKNASSTPLQTYTDTGATGGAVFSTGKPGVYVLGGGSSAPRLDNFSAGNITAGDVSVAASGSALTGGHGTASPVFSIGL